MATSSSNFVDNLTEGMYKDCHFFLKYESAKDNLIKYKYLSCNKDYSRKNDEGLKKKDLRTHVSFLVMMSITLFSC